MRFTNLAPELIKLRASLRPAPWPSYRAWLDANFQRINELSSAAAEAGDEPAPIVRAQFAHESWHRLLELHAKPNKARQP